MINVKAITYSCEVTAGRAKLGEKTYTNGKPVGCTSLVIFIKNEQEVILRALYIHSQNMRR
jgi:hypothetical protein